MPQTEESDPSFLMYLAPTLHLRSSPLQLSLTVSTDAKAESRSPHSSDLWVPSTLAGLSSRSWSAGQWLEALGATVQRSVLYACAQCHRVETFHIQWTQSAASMCLSLKLFGIVVKSLLKEVPGWSLCSQPFCYTSLQTQCKTIERMQNGMFSMWLFLVEFSLGNWQIPDRKCNLPLWFCCPLICSSLHWLWMHGQF